MVHQISAIALVLGFVGPLLAQAPAGFRTVRDEKTSLEYYAPADYSELPLPPTEAVLRARYRRKTPPPELKARELKTRGDSALPVIDVFCFEREYETSAAEGEPKGPDATGVTSAREYVEASLKVGSVGEFITKRLGVFDVTPVKEKEGHYDLKPKLGRQSLSGYMIIRSDRGQHFGAYGYSPEEHLPTLKRLLSQISQSLRFVGEESFEADTAAIDRIYQSSKLRAIEHRKLVRRGLARGWKALDTENYIIVHNTKDESLVSKIAKNIEAIRAVYAVDFPPVRAIEKVSIVRICKNRGEYMFYGGPPNAGGHFSPANEELVLFDYDQTLKDAESAGKKIRRVSDKDTLLVTYHEALHQYVYFAIGEVSPHDWFNEGHGDYYSGAVLSDESAKVQRIGPARWRIHLAKDLVDGAEPPVGSENSGRSELDEALRRSGQLGQGLTRIPLKNLLEAPRSVFYGARISQYYAAAWSFIHFMKTSEKVRAHLAWSGMLDRYFETLKSVYQAEVEPQGGANANLEVKSKATETAKKAALRASLENIKLEELEAEWISHVKKMKDPWPDQRPEKKK